MNLSKPLITLLMTSCIPLSHAELVPMDDGLLSEYTGQAFITIDNYNVTQTTAGFSGQPEEIDTEFYRINIGADMETHLSIDNLELGKFDRYENGEPCPASGCDPSRLQEVNDADISVKDFALGHYEKLSDGSVIDHPFKTVNPFLEFAFENRPDGTREVIGFRIGFEQAGGVFSGDIQSLTGNIDVLIKGTEWVFGFIPVQVEGQAYLQYGEDGDQNGENSGSLDPIRANFIGILDGDDISAGLIPDSYLLEITPEDCRTSTGTDTCQPLNKFQSMEVGKASDNGMVNNFFISSQSKDIAWAIDPNGNLNPSYGNNVRTGNKTMVVDENFTQTFLGAFMNIPSGGLELNPHETVEGLPRQPTRYTDAALGLF
ncbi:hypothetical protein [Litoribrevibacter albus]|uniref:PEP-CTERM sorting domain-containing protein n=1 Tax=Litoribrevibacter albus TaxID=1473156 RepID=A0AA37SCU1_9GAMM|nr:hypothetical protein [Litoribrevibacter albus]GLQ32390.1 hypothetical protein GCM10007876_28690 [Litoribrevibacter albus]